eukprot:CAMPEP_0195623650 /NCGR_PEP_ID=MMETSP0815-20121206/16870_1 /TAXON_ID=97485 /ORGANISM="Prymnesium parvum, Strain Texoma1" /LENGTH=43 /DNA_ID= /DNA_START= /DNA_END= /DNA_ORIENTATION=
MNVEAQRVAQSNAARCRAQSSTSTGAPSSSGNSVGNQVSQLNS